MIDIYMNDAAIHAEEPYEEEEAEVVLSEVLARNLDMPEGCIWASRYEEAFKKRRDPYTAGRCGFAHYTYIELGGAAGTCHQLLYAG
ncbi:MAG: hypothetical protein ACLUFD_11755 [Faecalibacterium sp.]